MSYSYKLVGQDNSEGGEGRTSNPLVLDDTHSVSYINERDPFPMLRNFWLTVLYLLILIANEVLVLVDKSMLNFPTDIDALIQAGILFFISLTYLIHRYYHRRARMRGYLRRYVEATRWVRAGLLVDANTACFICVANKVISKDSADSAGFDEAISVFVSIQNLILFYIYGNHALVCWRHNRGTALPDAVTDQTLPTSLSNTLLPVTPTHSSVSKKEIMNKQAVLIQGLEAQVRSLGQELVRQKGRQEGGRVNPRVLKAREDEVRALSIEKDVLRRDLNKARDEVEDLSKMKAIMMKENEEHASTISRQKKQIRLLQKEKSQLKILNEVHKETNANARKAIESLAAGQATTPLLTPAGSFGHAPVSPHSAPSF